MSHPDIGLLERTINNYQLAINSYQFDSKKHEPEDGEKRAALRHELSSALQAQDQLHKQIKAMKERPVKLETDRKRGGMDVSFD